MVENLKPPCRLHFQHYALSRRCRRGHRHHEPPPRFCHPELLDPDLHRTIRWERKSRFARFGLHRVLESCQFVLVRLLRSTQCSDFGNGLFYIDILVKQRHTSGFPIILRPVFMLIPAGWNNWSIGLGSVSGLEMIPFQDFMVVSHLNPRI